MEGGKKEKKRKRENLKDKREMIPFLCFSRLGHLFTFPSLGSPVEVVQLRRSERNRERGSESSFDAVMNRCGVSPRPFGCK